MMDPENAKMEGKIANGLADGTHPIAAYLGGKSIGKFLGTMASKVAGKLVGAAIGAKIGFVLGSATGPISIVIGAGVVLVVGWAIDKFIAKFV
ncbi:MAG: hypothetical protein IKU37_06435 [Candidatus Gastranaerophilales bacterium]|nr:hypothetical protein [Candidatus Gastranaerophilales bacterium]